MMDFLIYDVKVAVLIAVFYMFYRLMLGCGLVRTTAVCVYHAQDCDGRLRLQSAW